jgi:hypothetical protein
VSAETFRGHSRAWSGSEIEIWIEANEPTSEFVCGDCRTHEDLENPWETLIWARPHCIAAESALTQANRARTSCTNHNVAHWIFRSTYDDRQMIYRLGHSTELRLAGEPSSPRPRVSNDRQY